MKMRKIMSLLLAAMMLCGALMAGVTVEAKLAFNDTDGHWGESAIEFVVNNGLMNGVGDGKSFAPDMSLTRGMVVTVLYRDNGSPAQSFSGTFVDVAEGAYYTAAAEWAYANEIVNGTGTGSNRKPYFSPDRDITRQELATMFKRYADFKSVDTSVGGADIASFPDASSVADWAADAVKWAVGVGLITGKTNGGAATLSPIDKAVRAEFATIIKRFKESEASFEYHLVYKTPVPKSIYTEIPYAKVENADIYVAVDGNDNNPGTLAKPLATFEAAKAKVRELKKTAKDEIVVAFKAGDYGILDNATFTAEDSGSEAVPVTYCAYGDGEVYFTNGLYLDESDFKPLDESDKIFFLEENVNNIKKVELAGRPLADQITSFSPLSGSDGFCWVARTPNKENGIDQYFAGLTKHVPHPDSEYKTLNEILKDIFRDYDKYFPNGNADVAKNLDQNRLQTSGLVAEKLASYRTLEGVQLIGYIGKVWHSDTLEITGFDKETNIVSTTSPYYEYYAMVQSNQQAYINNASEELDDKGEYWIDAEGKTLYVYDPHGAYTMATNDTFITVKKNVNYITLRKLNFRCCSGEAIVANGSNFTFDQSSITYVGGANAFVSRNALNIHVTNSTVAYCAESGIRIEGPDPDKNPGYYMLENTGCIITNNLVHDIDMQSVPVESGAIRIATQVGAVVSHNEIYNSARYGIDFKYETIDCVMEYNYIHHCMQNSSDGGALYCGRTAIHRGNIVRYNIIADIYALNPIHTGGTFAIYMDDGHENLICYGNVFYNSGQLMNNGGRDHEIYDNVFIKAGSGITGKSNISDISQYEFGIWTEGWNDIRNIPDKNTEAGKIWMERWPELYDILAICNDPSCYKDTDLYNKPIAYCHNNYCFDGADHNFRDEWVEKGDLENNEMIPEGENTFFVNPTFGDYTIIEGADIMDNHFAQIGRY